MITDPLSIIAVLVGVILFSVTMVNRYPWAERLSAIMWILFTGALVSNIGLIPTSAPVYDTLIDFTVPFAVCLILFTVNLSDVLNAGRAMLAAFGLACLGTIIGVAVATISLEPLLASFMGDASWKLAGPYSGTYIGGSLNFFALWTGLEIDNPDLLGAANAVDNLTLFPLYGIWIIVPGILASRYVVSKKWAVPHDDETEFEEKPKPILHLPHLVTLFFLALVVLVLSNWLKAHVIDLFAPAVPSILIVTTLALLLAQVPMVRKLEGAWEMGDLAFYLFFAAVGALIDFYLAVVLSPALFLYCMVIILIHMLILYGGGRLMHMDVAALTIASVATKAGPALVPPVAEALESRSLILPGIIVAVLGYAIGNYVGFALAYAVRLFIG